jgi:hypothetical protein
MDMVKLIGTFHNYANVPKEKKKNKVVLHTTRWYINGAEVQPLIPNLSTTW